jgi:hypothetical protein
MEHLTGYVGGIVRSEKYKTGRDFFRLACPAQRCIRTKRRHFAGAGAVEFPFPSTFKAIFAARECLSRGYLRKGTATTKRSRKSGKILLTPI